MASRILVIDDETNIRTMIKLALEFSGYEVETAADGVEGLEKFGEGKGWDLVLLDQRMPGITGVEVQAEIHRRQPEARVVMITAFGTIDLALESMKNGAVDFLRKPFTADTLRLAVRSSLEKQVERTAAVPAGKVIGAFMRTTINGYSFNLIEAHVDDRSKDHIATFEVAQPDYQTAEVTVKLPQYVLELVKAYADCEQVPGGDRFWTALTEEALANFLWQNAELPPSRILLVDDLSANLQRWLDAVLTVDFNDCKDNA